MNTSSITEDDLKQARILIVDDDVGIICLLQNVFNRTGFVNHTSLTDSREAIQRIFALQPDLILLDLNMPNVTGFDVLHELRHTLPPDAFLPVLVVTGESDPKTQIFGCRRYGFSAKTLRHDRVAHAYSQSSQDSSFARRA
jgi:CheY-like chemotaxis protein